MTPAHQAPQSMGFPRQEYWSELPFPSPGDLSDPGVIPVSLASPALAGGFFTTSTTWETATYMLTLIKKGYLNKDTKQLMGSFLVGGIE